MIAVRPGTAAWAVLRLIVQHPAHLDAEAVARRLWPVPPPVIPPLSFDARDNSALRRWHQAREKAHADRQDRVRAARTRASRLIGRLAEAGLILPPQPPRIAEGWSDLVARFGGHAPALIAATSDLPDSAEDDPEDGPTSTPDDALLSAMIGIVTALDSGQPRQQAVGESGTDRRAWTRLVQLGIVIPAGFRVPSTAGVALIEGWTAGEVAA